MYAEAIANLPRLGQRYVDLNLWDADLFTDPAWRRDLRRRLDDAGLVVSSLQGGGRFGGVDAADAERQLELRRHGIAAAHDFGCDVIAATGPPRAGQSIEDVIRFLERLAPIAEASGVTHALEPHWQNRIEDLDDYRAIFAAVDSPAYAVALDTGHLFAAGVSIDRLLDELVDRVAVLHLKDGDRPASHDFVPFGRGAIDNRAVIRRCQASGFDGFAVIELEVPDMENCLAYLTEAYEHFRT
jgi:myo-inositol catabolism protein IolH